LQEIDLLMLLDETLSLELMVNLLHFVVVIVIDVFFIKYRLYLCYDQLSNFFVVDAVRFIF